MRGQKKEGNDTINQQDNDILAFPFFFSFFFSKREAFRVNRHMSRTLDNNICQQGV